MFHDSNEVKAIAAAARRPEIGDNSVAAAIDAFFSIGVESVVLSKKLFDNTHKLCLSAATTRTPRTPAGAWRRSSTRPIATFRRTPRRFSTSHGGLSATPSLVAPIEESGRWMTPGGRPGDARRLQAPKPRPEREQLQSKAPGEVGTKYERWFVPGARTTRSRPQRAGAVSAVPPTPNRSRGVESRSLSDGPTGRQTSARRSGPRAAGNVAKSAHCFVSQANFACDEEPSGSSQSMPTITSDALMTA